MAEKEVISRKKKTIICKGRILDLSEPIVMGILNITPNSFYDGGSYTETKQICERVEKMITEGAAIIDIGAVSTRPGAELIPEEEEIERLVPVLKMLRAEFKDTIFSVDTCWAKVAETVADCGADIINDISGGQFDEKMFETVARIKLPYILMHTKGMPHNMQKNPEYKDIVQDITLFFSEQLHKLYSLGVKDVILDPGFGFGKTIQHNFELLHRLDELQLLFDELLLVGLSRKSTIWKTLGITPQEALNGTTVLNTIALQKSANILRVHDVKEAMECIKLVKEFSAVGCK